MLEETLPIFDNPDICRGCALKTKVEIKNPEKALQNIRFTSILLNFHRYYCNCKCTYCSLWTQKSQPEFAIRSNIREMCSSGRLDPTACFEWGGGESTILPEFEETASWLLQAGYQQGFFTNGLVYSPAIEEALRQGKGWLRISLDSGSAEVFRQVKGVNAFNLVCNHIRRYTDAAQTPDLIRLKFIIVNENCNQAEVDKFFRFAEELGKVRVEVAYDLWDIQVQTLSTPKIELLNYFTETAKQKGFASEFWNDTVLPEFRVESLPDWGTKLAGQDVYFWGAGNFYYRHRQRFAQCNPRYILLDLNPENLTEVDGIPVRHPRDVLSKEEKLPIVIFAQAPAPILETIARDYPEYRQENEHICTCDAADLD